MLRLRGGNRQRQRSNGLGIMDLILKFLDHPYVVSALTLGVAFFIMRDVLRVLGAIFTSCRHPQPPPRNRPGNDHEPIPPS